MIDLENPDQREHSSERGSIHSDPDHLRPFSAQSDRRASGYGSSSRYSSQEQLRGGHSQSGSGSNRSGSIGSDGAPRPRASREVPTVPSSPGSSMYGRARLSAIGGFRLNTPTGTPQRSPAYDTSFGAQRSPAYDATFSSALTAGTAGTTTSATGQSEVSGGSHTTRTTLVDPETDEALHFPLVHFDRGAHN